MDVSATNSGLKYRFSFSRIKRSFTSESPTSPFHRLQKDRIVSRCPFSGQVLFYYEWLAGQVLIKVSIQHTKSKKLYAPPEIGAGWRHNFCFDLSASLNIFRWPYVEALFFWAEEIRLSIQLVQFLCQYTFSINWPRPSFKMRRKLYQNWLVTYSLKR